jgi:hypothetical protein
MTAWVYPEPQLFEATASEPWWDAVAPTGTAPINERAAISAARRVRGERSIPTTMGATLE